MGEKREVAVSSRRIPGSIMYREMQKSGQEIKYQNKIISNKIISKCANPEK